MADYRFILAVTIAYFLGNISPSTIQARMRGIDIKKEGSGNAGTTNTLRVLGARAALITLVVISIGGLMRYTRTNMLEVLNAAYIRTARAKGLSERKVIYHHAFRNTLIPLVTMLGGSLPGLFSGALITETLFSIRGIGYASYTSMTQADIPFIMFYLSFLSVLTLLGNLISDLLYAVVDPRVRLN